MPRKVRTHIPTDKFEAPTLTPKHLTKQEFAKRLYQLMVSKGWYQSELARHSGVPRDAVSIYMRGKSFPSPTNLQKLADAFGLQAEDLLPNQLESAIDEDHPAFEIKVSPNAPDYAWVRVNRLVSVTTALKIGELLQNETYDGSGSSNNS